MTSELIWVLIRQDDEEGNRYRVGRYPTRAEAERVADLLEQGQEKVYVIERLAPRGPQA